MVIALATALLGGPALDAWICRADVDASATVTALDAGVVVASADADQPDRGHPGPSLCAHGHCHHSTGLDVPAMAASALLTPSDVPQGWTTAVLHPSGGPAGLERPPRA